MRRASGRRGAAIPRTRPSKKERQRSLALPVDDAKHRTAGAETERTESASATKCGIHSPCPGSQPVVLPMTSSAVVTPVSKADARAFLVRHLHLHRYLPPSPEGARALLHHLRCIQIDPQNPMGTNQDLVAMARVENIARGSIGAHLNRDSFEHFAKERCILPAYAFPYYARHLPTVSWWSNTYRAKTVSEDVVAAVLKEVAEKGPCLVSDLRNHGSVKPLDWAGWRGTSKATAMALELLWSRCQVTFECLSVMSDDMAERTMRRWAGDLSAAPDRQIFFLEIFRFHSKFRSISGAHLLSARLSSTATRRSASCMRCRRRCSGSKSSTRRWRRRRRLSPLGAFLVL